MDIFDKEELVKGLENVKLVIGNGFDLYCGLKTHYSDYFNYKDDLYKCINNWFCNFGLSANNYARHNSGYNCWKDLERIDEINVWDIYFCLLKNLYPKHIDNWQWCDVERIIFDSVNPNSDSDIKPLFWESVFNYEQGIWHINQDTPNELCILVSIVHKKNNERLFADKNSFFEFLLSQLKLFEKDFGNYIYRIHFTKDPVKTEEIFDNYQKAFMKICNLDKVTSIDSFNFDRFEDEYTDGMLRNINGEYENPIFGTDSIYSEKVEQNYLFTKTNRRIELDMIDVYDYDESTFENAIVFGHSLNEADYSYFFPLLDKLNMLDVTKTNKIVFEYSIYDSKKENEIKSNLRTAINTLFIKYAIDRNYIGNPGRLIDSLTIYGRVLTFEVPSLKKID